MEKSKILQILGPGLAAAAVILLVGVLVTSSEWGGTAPTEKGKASAHGKPAPAVAVPKEEFTADGMTQEMPPADAPEWKPVGTDGLMMWDVKVGAVEPPCPAGANVTIHYTGWTLDGRSFDSSLKRGEPTTFGLGGLIKGWQIGIPGMKPGGVRRLKIPGPLAYGPGGGAGGAIPPNATLIFEVKLLGYTE